MYETFEHTADLGLRIRAASLEELFADAGRALFSAIVDNPRDIRPDEERHLRIEGRDVDYLLFDWLSELLYHFETEQLLVAEFEVTISETGLDARVRGEPVDTRRHLLAHEVKAVTYHRLQVAQTEEGWTAEVIIDI